MKHNKILTYILSGSLMLSVGSCSQDFLDRKPLTATMDDIEAGALDAQVFGIYSDFRSYGVDVLPWIALHDFRSDDSRKGSTDTDGAEWGDAFDKFNYSVNFGGVNDYWNGYFGLINKANNVIDAAGTSTDPNTLVNVGEAKFIRAYAYFNLVRVFGEVPKIDFKLVQASDANIAKSSVNDIYALIDADLKIAEENLPISWEAQYIGRLTKGAAKTLVAQTQITRKNWAGALEKAKEVEALGVYSLYPTYWEIFKDKGENSSESIFEIQCYAGPNQTDDFMSTYATSQGVRGNDASGWNLGWGWNTPTENLVNAYEAGDKRKNSSILFAGQSDDPAYGGYGATLVAYPSANSAQPYWNKKTYADPAMRKSTGRLDQAGWINHRIMRYADIILMIAECSNELGDGATAERYLEMVRARARGTESVLPKVMFASQTQMRTAIKHERRVEFALEGYRFFDLVRWEDATTVLAPLGYTAKHKFMPIPQQAIDASGGKLVQSPDWK